MRRFAPAALAIAATALPAPALASVSVATDPPLHPAFDRGISDYYVRCPKDGSVAVLVHAHGGERVAVDGDQARGGDFTDAEHRRAGESVTIRVESTTRPGAYHVRCLPRGFPEWTTTRPGTPRAQGYVATPIGRHQHGYVAIFNSHGVPIWWRGERSYGPWNAAVLPGGDIAWTHYKGGPFGRREAYGFEEHRLDGRSVRRIRTHDTPTDTHDLERLPNGRYLALTYVPRHGVDLRRWGGDRDALVYDGEIQELTADGRLVWRWSSRDHVATRETRWWRGLNRSQRNKEPGDRHWDLVHINSVEPDGHALIVSFRHANAVFKIDRATGKVLWKLGGAKRRESLRVVGDPYGQQPFGGQHDARVWTDGTVTVFDNETNKHRPPRAVRYRIDENARTATLVEQIDPPRPLESQFGGSARKLAGGSWVVYWGGSTLFSEQQPFSGDELLGVDLADELSGYRVVPLPPDVSVADVRRGMDAMVARQHAAAR